MTNKEKLIKELTEEKDRLEKALENNQTTHWKNSFMRKLINTGIALDFVLPIILSLLIVSNITSSLHNTPFKKDLKVRKTYIETIDTSNGIHIEHQSLKDNYNKELLEHSTGWIINDKGLYERTITSYRINDSIDLNDINKVLSMSKEEIENSLIVTNRKTIQKKYLDSEDYIYNEENLIILNHAIDESKTATTLETTGENIEYTLAIIFLWIIQSRIIAKIKYKLFKTRLKDTLTNYSTHFTIITPENQEEMKRLLELKRNNLELLTSSEKCDKSYPYQLRKDM